MTRGKTGKRSGSVELNEAWLSQIWEGRELTVESPIYWEWLDEARRSEGSCGTDVCWLRDDRGDEARFVRGTIELPILDAEPAREASFVIGVWASLSETNFTWLMEHWTAGPDEQGEPWFGWLSNRVPVYPDTLGLKTRVRLRGDDLRPLIEVQPGDHPLARDQHEGMTLARARELGEQWLHV